MRRIATFVLGLLALCVLFNLFVKLLIAARPGQPFYFHWDAVGFLFGSCLLCVATLIAVERWVAVKRGLRPRITSYLPIVLLAGVLYVTLGMALNRAIEGLVFGKGTSAYLLFTEAMYHAVIYLLIAGAFVWHRYSRELRRAHDELLVAERARAEMELAWLQHAVDPHFLFNNLNILCALIEGGKQPALPFARTLASLYRYILRHRQAEVVPLGQELGFARDYAYLLGQRYGASFRCEIAEDPADADTLAVVPTALQGLIENAAKHNRGTRSDPLVARIGVDGDTLYVENTLRRAGEPASHGTGLADLQARYARLGPRPVRIHHDDRVFRVELPLLRLLDASSAALAESGAAEAAAGEAA